MSLERTVSDPAALADRQEIVDAITSLFIATDEKNWPAALACFADQVLFDMSSLTGSPAAATPAGSRRAPSKRLTAPSLQRGPSSPGAAAQNRHARLGA